MTTARDPYATDKTCHPMPGKRTNKEYHGQGWNAALKGHSIDECPYYATSTAEKHWKAGFRSA
jgi:ribosome modulation factor